MVNKVNQKVRRYLTTKRELLYEGIQHLTSVLEDKEVVKICRGQRSYTGLRISYRHSSIRYGICSYFSFINIFKTIVTRIINYL